MSSIIYLHGFHSSPNSEKAIIFKQQLQSKYPDLLVIAPQIVSTPEQAIVQVEQLVKQHLEDCIGIVGSSLGGYLATYLHNKYNLPIVIVNPAVRPFNLLDDYVGPQTHPITMEQYQLTSQHMSDLKNIYQEDIINKESVWLLQQEKDEVLDYTEALDKYQGCKIHFELGGCHGFERFERFPLQIVEFFMQHKQIESN